MSTYVLPGPTLAEGLPHLALLPTECIGDDPMYEALGSEWVHGMFWCPRHDSRLVTFSCCNTTRVVSSPAAAESARALHECEVAS